MTSPEPNPRALRHMAKWGARHIASCDIDPVYPVLRALYAARRLTPEEAFWQTFLYMAFYHLPSGLAVYRMYPSPTQIGAVVKRFPCAFERRGFRGGKVVDHIRDGYSRIYGGGTTGALATVQADWGYDLYRNYEHFWKWSQTLWGNGPWAAFKWAEILKKCHSLPLAAPDMKMKQTSSLDVAAQDRPKTCLCWLYGVPVNTDVATLNEYGNDLKWRLAELGCAVEDWEELETLLCDYYKYRQDKYDTGHDIIELEAAIKKANWLHPSDTASLLEAMAAGLPPTFLGKN